MGSPEQQSSYPLASYRPGARAAPNTRFAKNDDDIIICWADSEVCVTHAWTPSVRNDPGEQETSS